MNLLAREKDGTLLLVAVNPARKATVATFSLPEKPSQVEPLYDGTGYTLEGTALKVSFAPLQRQVWRIRLP